MMVTVIGRGHSGTRAVSNTLHESGFYMGEPLNGSWDLVPPEKMYKACAIFGDYVTYKGNLEWDFTKVLSMEPTAEFRVLIEEYLHSVLASDAPDKGWKIPETTLCYPWIKKLFPEVYYIHWVRDPRDCILGGHVTDDLAHFHIEAPQSGDEREQRAISWKYQRELMCATPDPAHVIRLRFEDMVFSQEETLQRLAAFLGRPMAKIPMRPDSVGRYKTAEGKVMFDFFRQDLAECGYEL